MVGFSPYDHSLSEEGLRKHFERAVQDPNATHMVVYQRSGSDLMGWGAIIDETLTVDVGDRRSVTNAAKSIIRGGKSWNHGTNAAYHNRPDRIKEVIALRDENGLATTYDTAARSETLPDSTKPIFEAVRREYQYEEQYNQMGFFKRAFARKPWQ